MHRSFHIKILIVLSLFITFLSTSPVAIANEKEAGTPVTKFTQEAENLLKDLSEDQAKKYLLIRETHGVIRSVQSVEALVEKAVKSCKDGHVELGEQIQKRFNEWKLAVHPVIKSGEDRLEKLILLQDYAKPSEVKEHLKNFDLAAEYGEKLIDPKPASDEKSCKSLLKNMDNTQPNLIRLLKQNIGLE